MLLVELHPLLDLCAFETSFPRPLGEMASPPELLSLLSLESDTPGAGFPPPLRSDDSIRETIRALLRHGGFKPTGRSKPASEYLIKAVKEGMLTSINLAVDVCNIVSLHSGLPPFRVALAPPGSSYVFNASGQVLDLGGLLCLFDAEGPCANAVKDAQRTKTSAQTRRTLSLIWGSQALPGRTAQAVTWYRQLLKEQGATTEDVT